ncbi:MAG: class I SAM-dependent methyltransferase [Candidatus Delongbacteria bacterium]|nr:class I SAM-dependent methyltransferase [Candidatus Delongbacteria bacterium]
MKPWYEKLFENYACNYDKESFTQGTLGECDFIEKEAGYRKNLRILDVGCGTGRHAIELAKRGYRITGIDLSESQLKRAREKAMGAGVSIDFQKQDARDLPFNQEFDLAIMMCEGGFPLMETDEMNYQILQSVTRSLAHPGKLIFTTLNGLFPLHHSIEEFCASAGAEGNASYHKNTFDLMTFRDYSITEWMDDDGHINTTESNERYYIPSEITWLLKTLGYRTIELFGAKLGDFSRNDALTTEDFEMLVIAEK